MRSWRAGRLRGGLCLRLLEIDFVMRMSLELGYTSNDCFHLTLSGGGGRTNNTLLAPFSSQFRTLKLYIAPLTTTVDT
jgi:hypothetical protein